MQIRHIFECVVEMYEGIGLPVREGVEVGCGCSVEEPAHVGDVSDVPVFETRNIGKASAAVKCGINSGDVAGVPMAERIQISNV